MQLMNSTNKYEINIQFWNCIIKDDYIIEVYKNDQWEQIENTGTTEKTFIDICNTRILKHFKDYPFYQEFKAIELDYNYQVYDSQGNLIYRDENLKAVFSNLFKDEYHYRGY